MNVILFCVKWQFALVYLDDVVICNKTPDQHIDHVWKVLLLQYNAGPTLKLKKCSFFTDTMEYVGNVVRLCCFELASHTADTIRGLEPTASLTKLRSFWAYATSSDNLTQTLGKPHLRWTNNWRKNSHKQLNHLTAKHPRPRTHWGTRWYHPLRWYFHNLVETWPSTQTRAMYQSAASYSKSIQKTRQTPLVTGHDSSPTSSNNTTTHNEKV